MLREVLVVDLPYITIIQESLKTLLNYDLQIYRILYGEKQQMLQINLCDHELCLFEHILPLNMNIFWFLENEKKENLIK
jgi:hypothetical protein